MGVTPPNDAEHARDAEDREPGRRAVDKRLSRIERALWGDVEDPNNDDGVINELRGIHKLILTSVISLGGLLVGNTLLNLLGLSGHG